MSQYPGGGDTIAGGGKEKLGDLLILVRLAVSEGLAICTSDDDDNCNTGGCPACMLGYVWDQLEGLVTWPLRGEAAL